MTGMFDSMYMPIMPYMGTDAYSNQVYLNDMTGFNWFTPPFNAACSMPLCNMNTSIWNMPSVPFTGGCACDESVWNMPYAGGGYYGYAGTPGTGVAGNYYDNMTEYYQKMVDSQVKYQKESRKADMAMNSAQKKMRQKGLQLQEKIELNEQDQIYPAFKEYVESVRSYYGDECSEEDLVNTALQHYEEQFGKTIQKDIREHGSNSYVSGVKEISFLGLGDKTSAEQNIAKITGQREGKTEKIWKSLGNISAGAVLGTLAGLAKGLFMSNKKFKAIWTIGGAIAGFIGGKLIDKAA